MGEREELLAQVVDAVAGVLGVEADVEGVEGEEEELGEPEEMDMEIQKLASTLSKSNPEAMQGLKKIMWEGTEHWDALLAERAESSGKLVLSDFTKDAIAKFKQQ